MFFHWLGFLSQTERPKQTKNASLGSKSCPSTGEIHVRWKQESKQGKKIPFCTGEYSWEKTLTEHDVTSSDSGKRGKFPSTEQHFMFCELQVGWRDREGNLGSWRWWIHTGGCRQVGQGVSPPSPDFSCVLNSPWTVARETLPQGFWCVQVFLLSLFLPPFRTVCAFSRSSWWGRRVEQVPSAGSSCFSCLFFYMRVAAGPAVPTRPVFPLYLFSPSCWSRRFFWVFLLY